jgi:hypothetical protein
MAFIAMIPALIFVLWIVSEYRSPRRMRLTLGVGSVIFGIVITLTIAWMQRSDLAGHYRSATVNLAYSVEAAIQKGRALEVAAELDAFRDFGVYDLGTPSDYYRQIELLAERINTPDQPIR